MDTIIEDEKSTKSALDRISVVEMSEVSPDKHGALYVESDLNERLSSTDSTLMNDSRDEGSMFARTFVNKFAGSSNPPSDGSKHRISQSVSLDSSDFTIFDQERDNIVFDSGADIYWTKRDQVRLQNLDNLHGRMMEHHNNVHTRIMYENWEVANLYTSSKLTDNMRMAHQPSAKADAMAVMRYSVAAYDEGKMLQPAFLTKTESDCFLADYEWDDPAEDADSAAFVQKWRKSVSQTMTEQTRKDLKEKLTAEYDRNSSKRSGASAPTTERREANEPFRRGSRAGEELAKKDFLWIHIMSLASLESIGARFGLHDLVITGFRDIRTSANFLPVPGAVFFCFCSFRLTDKDDVELTKIYLYVSYTTNLIISFERKIMQRGIGVDMDKHGWAQARRRNAGQEVFQSCLKLDYTNRFRAVLEYGSVEIITMLTQRALSMQDPLITLLSRAIVYFKEVGDVGVKLYYREKAFVTKQLLVVKKSFQTVQVQLLEAKYTFTCLHTFLCTGTFKARDLYANMEEEAGRDHKMLSQEYMDFVASNLHVNFSGMGSTASNKSKPIGNRGGGGVKLAPTQLNTHHGRLFDIDIADCADERTVLYKEYQYCLMNGPALEKFQVVKDDFRTLADMMRDQFADLAMLEKSSQKKDDLRRINIEILVALVTVSSLPLTFIIGSASMNFSDYLDFDNHADKVAYFYYWYHAPHSYIITYVFCSLFTMASFGYFGYLGLVDFSANTRRKLLRVMSRYITCGWSKQKSKMPKKQYKSAVRRADGTVVASVNTYSDDRDRSKSIRISEGTLERIRRSNERKRFTTATTARDNNFLSDNDSYLGLETEEDLRDAEAAIYRKAAISGSTHRVEAAISALHAATSLRM